MERIDYRVIEQLSKQARRERSCEVYRLMQRLAFWVQARMTGARMDRAPVCCQPA